MTVATDAPLLVGTSWKMNKTLAEAREFIDDLHAHGVPDGVQAFVLPPHTALAEVHKRLPSGSPLWLGAQNAHWATEGAHTGEVSMRMVADAGAVLVEIGHSERRTAFGETDESVARKVEAALDHDLVPLVCVGEPVGMEGADAVAYVVRQVRAAVSRVPIERVASVIFAYEPLGAIGSAGEPARPERVADMVAALRRHLRDAANGSGPLLYGGSVSESNAQSLVTQTGVDGLFVGRAAWSSRGFARILTLCAETRRADLARDSGSRVDPQQTVADDRSSFSTPVDRPA